MLGALVIILTTVAFVFVVVRLLEVPLPRRTLTLGSVVHRLSPVRRWPRQVKGKALNVSRSLASQRSARLARSPDKLTASWKLIVAIVLIAVGAAIGAMLAIRSILGLLEGMVS